MFPELEALSGQTGLMDDPKHQHALFHDALEKLLEYASTTSPEAYTWEGPGGMKALFDAFATPLTDHLYAEIDVLLALSYLDNDKLRQTWDKTEKVAQKAGSLAMLVSIPISNPSNHASRQQNLTSSMTSFPPSWAAPTSPSTGATSSRPCPQPCRTRSSTGSPRATARGASTRATGGGGRGRWPLGRRRTGRRDPSGRKRGGGASSPES